MAFGTGGDLAAYFAYPSKCCPHAARSPVQSLPGLFLSPLLPDSLPIPSDFLLPLEIEMLIKVAADRRGEALHVVLQQNEAHFGYQPRHCI
jgi:hypothetical protein